MIDQQKLKTVLERLPVASPMIDVIGTPPALIATVVSGSFGAMDESKRQELVWKHLRTSLDDADDIAQIEFVITNAPDEVGEGEGVAEEH